MKINSHKINGIHEVRFWLPFAKKDRKRKKVRRAVESRENRNYNKNRLVARILTGGHTLTQHNSASSMLDTNVDTTIFQFRFRHHFFSFFFGCHSSRFLHILPQHHIHICIWQLPNTNTHTNLQQQLSCTEKTKPTEIAINEINRQNRQKTSTKRNETNKKMRNRQLKSNLKQTAVVQKIKRTTVGDTFFPSFFSPSNANKTNKISASERND